MDSTLLFSLIAGAALVFILKSFRAKGLAITPIEAQYLVEIGALLVDVRSPQEFAQGHIKGAKNIPLPEINQRLNEFGDKERPVVLCCQSGTRSGMAAHTLKKAGYVQVYNLGSWQRWNS
jgi:phage shock protein E